MTHFLDQPSPRQRQRHTSLHLVDINATLLTFWADGVRMVPYVAAEIIFALMGQIVRHRPTVAHLESLSASLGGAIVSDTGGLLFNTLIFIGIIDVALCIPTLRIHKNWPSKVDTFFITKLSILIQITYFTKMLLNFIITVKDHLIFVFLICIVPNLFLKFL